MRTLIICLFLLLGVGCTSSKLLQITADSNFTQDIIPDSSFFFNHLELFTFNVALYYECPIHPGEKKGTLGKAFIMDGEIWTAKHVEGESPFNFNIDQISLGPAPIQGLVRCTEEHIEDDEIYFTTVNRGIFQGKLDWNEGNWQVPSNRIYIRGDSGASVLCVKHRKVVGILVGLKTQSPNVGIISPLNPKLVEKTKII